MSTTDAAELVTAIQEQERTLVFPAFTLTDAWTLGSLLVARARAAGAPVAIDIQIGEQQVFHAALPGSCADNDQWIQRKIRTVRRFGVSSYLVGRRLAAAGKDFAASTLLDPTVFAAHGGAFPITVAGVGVIGTVAVSGLPQADDHALLVAVLTEHLGLDRRD